MQNISLRGFKHLDRAVDAGRKAAEEALAAGGKEALEPRLDTLAARITAAALSRWAVKDLNL